MKRFIYLLVFIISLTLYTLTIRGSVGNPTPNQIEYQLNSSGNVFETSQERSRWALILSLVNYGTINIDNYASMGTPDIGKINGHYYSFFPPAASVLAIPLYIIGEKIGMSQLFTFASITIFAMMLLLLMVKFTQKMNLHWSISLFSALAFGFATNAWGYSVTLYAHIVSAFLLLLGLYITLFFDEKDAFLKGVLVWTLYGISVFVDFPNLFIFLPIVLILTRNIISITDIKSAIKLKLNWAYVFTPLVCFMLMASYGYYNYVNFGSPTVLSNSIPRVQDLKIQNLATPEKHKNNGQALNTRNMLEGFHSFTISSDRGILIYSPVAVLFVFGLGILKKSRKVIEVGLVSIPATCLILYTMFGDPYGGWAFGSRYMIAVLPELCILAGIGLARFSKSILVKLLYSGVFIYSAAISLLAPLTTNVIPPLVEARGLGLKANYLVNWEMLNKDFLNSYIYNAVFFTKVSAMSYYLVILTIVLIAGLTAIWIKRKGAYETISE